MNLYTLTLNKSDKGNFLIGCEKYELKEEGGLRETLSPKECEVRDQLLRYAKARLIYQSVIDGKAPDTLELRVEVNIK